MKKLFGIGLIVWGIFEMLKRSQMATPHTPDSLELDKLEEPVSIGVAKRLPATKHKIA